MNGLPDAPPIILTEAERTELEALARSTKPEYRLRQRARVVLGAAEGVARRAIGRGVGCTTGPGSKWRVRHGKPRPRRRSASWPGWMGRFLRGTRVGLVP